MTSEAEKIISEINQMREQWFMEVEAGARRTWPKSIRERVMHLIGIKISCKEIAKLTSVPYETIGQWRHYRKKMERRFHAVQVRNNNGNVTVAGTETESRNLTVTVTTPNGYRMEGPTNEVLKILQALGGG